MYKLYIKDTCPFCVKAKKLLDDNKIVYQVFGVYEGSDFYGEWKKLAVEYDYHTVPMIFKDGELLGGYTELSKLLGQGEEHNVFQKISWWLVTAFYFVTSRNCKYATRMHNRQKCIDSCNV